MPKPFHKLSILFYCYCYKIKPFKILFSLLVALVSALKGFVVVVNVVQFVLKDKYSTHPFMCDNSQTIVLTHQPCDVPTHVGRKKKNRTSGPVVRRINKERIELANKTKSTIECT